VTALETRSSWEEAVTWLRAQPDRQDLVLAAYYDDPLIEAAHRYWQSDEWRCICSLLLPGPGKDALDVGAGRGIASYALAKEGMRVTALEPDPSELVGAGAIRGLVAQCSLPIQVVEHYSEQLPFADNSFDVVFGRAVLHHTRDLRTACREFFRVLRPGGLLMAVREHVISRPGDLQAFHVIHPLHARYGGEMAFLLKDYVEAITAAGFTLKNVVGPLRSPINYSPANIAHLRSQIAHRAVGALPGLIPVARAILSVPVVWSAMVPILEAADHRPGRLYSFVAGKP
jgi:ubiquinone/menaquinone biosynthesis C-methylase UbiE